MGQASRTDPVPAEAALQAAWAALRRSHPLLTAEGERIHVLFPGIANHGAGPDFSGAVIATERGRVVRGDVEVHRSEAGWRDHGHQHDARYDRVVLHVVADRSGAGITELPNGCRVPVARLALPSPEPQTAAGLGHPCGECTRGLETLGLLPRLAALGLLRLRRKALAWRRLDSTRSDACLASACLEMLVGPRNRSAMRAVSASLGSAGWKQAPALRDLQCRFLHVAGLAPPSGWLSAAVAPPLSAGVPPAAHPHWDHSGYRPAAHPARRLLGAAVWYQRWSAAGGPAAWLLAQPVRPAALARAFSVSAEEALLSGPAPVGRDRAAAVVLNVAYPFLLARAQNAKDNAATTAITDAWNTSGALEADAVVRSLTGALSLAGVALKASHQQGMHHLYRHCCRRGRQAHCLLRQGGAG